ncbi:MAG: low molecular weight phosphatase family protein [Cyclobacteriaceae bacterium]|nr:MAG: low molecular weight phosphatase family protein [Cyclobacteriaceae bacterium]
MDQVLFICTGNYYRSRYAEILFNQIASEFQLGWRSFSRGFQESNREAPISPHAVNRLHNKNIYPNQVRYPIKLKPSDLALAHRVILLDQQEHKPMMEKEYSEWADYVEYWNIQDVDFEAPHSALDRLERKIDLLISELETNSNQMLWDNNHIRVQFS